MKEKASRDQTIKSLKKKKSSLPELITSKKISSIPNDTDSARQQKRVASLMPSPRSAKATSGPLGPLKKNGMYKQAATQKKVTTAMAATNQRSKSLSSATSKGGRFSQRPQSIAKQQAHYHQNNHALQQQQSHHARSTSSNKSSDVELIVRKKLITTTTTTTMTPIHADLAANSTCDLAKAPEENKTENYQETSQNSMQKINSNSMNDVPVAMSELLPQHSLATNDILASSSMPHVDASLDNNINNDLMSVVPHPSYSQPQSQQQQQQITIVNNRLTSTVKKEQLEYEFRLRPRTVVYKSFNNSINSNCISRKKNPKKSKKFHKGKMRTNEEESNELNDEDGEDDEEDDENDIDEVGADGYYSEKHHKGGGEGKDSNRRQCSSDANTRRTIINLCSLFMRRFIRFSCVRHRRRQRSYIDSDDDEDESMTSPSSLRPPSTLRQLISVVFCCPVTRRPKADKHHDIMDQQQLHSASHAIITKSNNNKKQQNAMEEYIERPPVTCIRVLRPSNDLTPVRFDSHYNIIQAVAANFALSSSDSLAAADAATSLPSPPSSDEDKNAVDVISSIMEDAIKQQQQYQAMIINDENNNDFDVAAYTKV